ncbi:MAG: helix-turn-helix domain-containing protein [Halofilum sp. (in: g-proteobacteria)]|nr:helix-turn-helix domain-containing protein [Halofilum sp. (in: g-proteobacteria)]
MTEDDAQPNVERGTTRRPGQDLRAARERAGIEQEELATNLHLTVDQVKAIEADDYEHLPPAAFVRGYLRAYAREVGLNADEIVAEFDAASGESGDPEIVLQVGEPDPGAGHGPIVALVIVVLVAAIGMGAWWLQQDRGLQIEAGDAVTGESVEPPPAEEPAEEVEPGTADSGEDAPPEPAAPEPPAGEADTGAASGTEEPVSAAGGSDSAAAAEAEASATPEPSAAPEEPVAAEAETAAEAPAADGTTDAGDAAADSAAEPEAMVAEGEQPRVTSNAAEVATAAAATGPDVLVIEVDGRSWLEVFDVRGRQLAYTLYSGDEPVRLQGYAPFDVFLGNSPDVSLRFGDDPVDHSAFVRSDNTARFVVDAEGASRR